MDVVIFCGGRGTRLMEKTTIMPKSLVNIGNKPILWHIMKNYSHFGHNRFILTLGYKGEMIKRYFLEFPWLENHFEISLGSIQTPKPKEDWNVVLLDTGIETNTQKRFFLSKEHIKSDRFMTTYGDGIGNINLHELEKRHDFLNKKYGVLGTITVLNPESRFGIVRIGEHIVEDFKEKPIINEFVNIGYMVFEKYVLDMIDESDVMMETHLLEILAKEGKLGFYHHKGFWECMDSYKDYTNLNNLYKNGMPWKVWND